MSSVLQWYEPAVPLPLPGDCDASSRRWDQFRHDAEALGAGPELDFAKKADSDPHATALLNGIFGNSAYLSDCILRDLGFSCNLLSRGPDPAFEAALRAVSETARVPGEVSNAEVMTKLRVAKRRASLAIAIADIATHWNLEKITESLSDLAEASLRASCRHLLFDLFERGKIELLDPSDPEKGSGLVVLGMGKLGAKELNYSSDIDIIVLYDEEACPCDSYESRSIYSRLARSLVGVMGKRTPDGYVFRTDIRLRPDTGSSAAALSTEAALDYYRTLGQTWERAAMIKARCVAGDDAAGEKFLRENEQFAWRRNLDFISLRDIQSIKQKINAHKGSDRISVEGQNVKLGRGGIREIEFFAQTQQLIWGGRTAELRSKGTLEALDSLVAAGRVTVENANRLKRSYKFLRRIEHRIQMVEDQQTHTLPTGDSEIEKFSLFAGYESAEKFSGELLAHLREVEGIYGGLFGSPGAKLEIAEETVGSTQTETSANLAELGYSDPERSAEFIWGWLEGNHRSLANPKSRELLAELAPRLVSSFAASPRPDAAVFRFDSFLGRINQSVNLLSMLSARPELLDIVAKVMGAAPLLAEWLAKHPQLLESVLQRDFEDLELPAEIGLEPELAERAHRGLVKLYYAREFGSEELFRDLGRTIESQAAPDDFQGILDAQRRWCRDRKFQAGVHILRGDLTPVDASKPFCRIAETSLNRLLPLVECGIRDEFGQISGGGVAVVAFGRLGSEEMTISSDLDLMFIYDHDESAFESDGLKRISPSQYFARLFRRFINAIAAQTPEGRLYDVDMRLRPSGKSGPIACSIGAFETYQMEKAWVWEYQALTKARVIYAENGLRTRLDEIIRNALTKPRNQAELAAEVASMRQKIRGEFGSGGPWAIKLMRGGLFDLDFIAQYFQLLHASSAPSILCRDALSVFNKMRDLGIYDTSVLEDLAETTVLWRNLLGMLLLTSDGRNDESETAESLKSLISAAGDDAVFDSIEATVRENAERTAGYFDSILSG
ncbi:MAG: bifunctional [glutamate--ammonia ligase]-adenylyl-L-tyrosine phosphorylase/[glutamate--ammonia-ligase] adenylyltransferase [Albidovulum sp.]|nr:bifunctional [glutamate--ammonia ligase]-adenylyl-L-tyrosine phosphorylase/[glutamate--ammonia-ligase] adenylyltransferase [Albidovulum sp.]